VSLGNLTIRLGLDAADFITGMTKSEAQAKKFADNLDRNIAAGIVKAQIALEALGAGARTAAGAFQALTTGAAAFKDLEESTGASAESIASLAVSAATAGVEINDIGGALNKLTKNLVGVDDESKAAGAALKAIGINIKEFKALDPVGQYEAVGKALGAFADGSEKVAVAQALFGKTGPEQLRVFKALEEAGGRQKILTQEQIDLSDAYADRQAKSAATLKLYAQAAASQAIPALNDLTIAATEFVKAAIGIDEQTGKLAKNNNIKEFAEGAITTLTVAADAVLVFSRMFEAASKTVGGVTAALFSAKNSKEGKAIIKDLLNDLDEIDNRGFLTQKLHEQRAKSAAATASTGSGQSFSDARFESQRKPKIPYKGADTTGAARFKNELDGQIKAIREFAQQERDAYDFANRFVKGTLDDGLISLQEYYAEQKRIRDAGLAAQFEALDKEKAALEKALPKSKDADRIDIQNKLAEVVAKRADVMAKAGQDGVLAAQEEARAVQQLQDRYDDLRASILEMGGDKAVAAAIRIAQQVEAAKKLSKQAGGNDADVDKYRKQLETQQQLTELQNAYLDIVYKVDKAEERAAMNRLTGRTNEIGQLAAVGEARRESVKELESVVAAQEALANTSGNKALIREAEEARRSLERLAATADPLARQFNEMFENSFGDALGDFITGTKSAKDAFRSFTADVTNEISRLVAKNLAQLIFGGSSPSTGGGFGSAAGSFLSSLFGGFGTVGATAGGAAGSGSSWDSSIASFFGSMFGGGKAIGGPTMPNTLYQVAERRPEVYSDGSGSWLLTGSRHGSVDPNPSFAGARNMTVNQTFVVQGTPNRNTQTQIYAESARGVSRASARNN